MMAKKKKVVQSAMKCECTPASYGWLVLSAVAAAIGLYAIVQGINMQWGTMRPGMWMNTVLWYTGGVFVLCIACAWKKKVCPTCW